MRKTILAALIGLAMVSTIMPVASGPVQFGHAWGTSSDEYATAVDVDSNGNIYLSGVVRDSGMLAQKAFVAKTSIIGTLMWDLYLSSPTNNLFLYDSALGPSNSLYVVGEYRSTIGEGGGTFYAKVDSSGSLVYQKFLSGMSTPNRICSDKTGNGFIIVGDITYYGTGAVVAVNDNGSVRWSLGASSPHEESPWATLTDSAGSVYVFMDSIYDSNVALAKFDGSGQLIKQITLLTDPPNYEYTWDLALGLDGNIYALGANYGTGSLLMASFTPQLNLIWDEYVGAPINGYEATRLVVAADGSLYAVGYSTYTSNGTSGPAVFHFDSLGAVLESMYFAQDSNYGSLYLGDAAAYPGGGVVLAGNCMGIPQTISTAIDGIAVSPVPNGWTQDSVLWASANATAATGDLVREDANGVMDNFDVSQGSQAWFGVMDPPPPAFDVSISVRIAHDSNEVTLRGHASGGHSPYTFAWNLGDGTTGSGQRISHTYSMGGVFHVYLTVTDGRGLVSWSSVDVVLPAPPLISQVWYYPDPAYVLESAQFEVSAYDPDGGVLTDYFWDFGDGTSTSTAEPMATHTYSGVGFYNLTVTVTDDEGATSGAMTSVQVVTHPNISPVAIIYYSPPNPVVGDIVTFDGSASYDMDGTIVSYSWNFGDQTNASGVVVNHVYFSAGTYNVSLMIMDNMGAFAYTQQLITVQPGQQGDIVLNERFDSWSSLDPGWSFWNCTDPLYNYIDIRNGMMYMSDYADIPVNDSFNARASWTSFVQYPEALKFDYRLYLPLASDEKYGYWGQWVAFDLFAPSDNQNDINRASITSRFLMDTWTGAVNGWSYVGSDGYAHKICDFQAGWHNISVRMERNSTIWTAGFDGTSYPGLTFYNPGQTGFDLSKLMFVNSLREEVVSSGIDDLVIQRMGANAPPVASFTYSVDGSTVHVDASSSSPQAGIVSYSWDWGDGSAPQMMATPYASHTYSAGHSLTTTGTLTAALANSKSSAKAEDIPPLPFDVFGYVTDANGSPILNCELVITDTRTGSSFNTTTDDQSGFYMYDLTLLSGGFQNGDSISVTVDSGGLYGSNEGVVDTASPYLWIDVVVQSSGNVVYYSVTLTVTDTQGLSSSVSHLVPISVAPVGPDAYEPDDDFLSATVLDFNSSQVHSIHNGGADVDWYVFTVPINTDVVLETWGTSGDTMLYLYDQNGVPNTPIASDDNSGVGSFSRILINTSSAGTYYAKVTEADMNAEIASYTIRLGESAPTAQWTFMVYLDGDNNLEDVALIDFLEMSSAGSDQNVNIVVEMDRSPWYTSDYGDWTGTKRFYVTPGMTPTAANAIADLGEQNMGSQDTLLDFVTWATTNYPAENYMLDMWDHGGGWDGAVCFDETNNDAITLDELEFALSGNMNNTGEWIDSVGFDACLMGMVEVSYEIKEWTDVMVASEESIPWDGWSYDTIMADLVADPYMTPSEFGSVVVQRYMEFYGMGGYETMSALDVAAASDLYSRIDAFSYLLRDYLTTNGTAIANAWASTDWFSYEDYLDLYDFANTLASLLPGGSLRNEALNVTAEVTSAIISESHGAGHADARGVSIYFPAYGYIFDYDYLDFAVDTGWNEFVRQFSNGTGASDSYEPDDSYTQASPISFGETQTHSIDEGGADVDWVTFTVYNTTDITVSTSGPQGDTILYLYDSYGVPNTAIAYNDDYNGLWSRITYTVSPGTYYVKVVDFGMDSNIPLYYLTLVQGSGYNQAPYANMAITPLPPYVGVSTTFDGTSSYDVDGYIVQWTWYFDWGVPVTGPVVNHTYDNAGTHYVMLEVVDDDGASGSVTWGFDVVNPATPDAYEPDNYYMQATPISPGEMQVHSISNGGYDADWLTFTLGDTSDVRLEAMTTGYSVGCVNLSLYSSASLLTGPIAVSDWQNSSGIVALQCVLGPGTYYVNVTSSYGVYEVSEYQISLTLSPVSSGDEYEPDDIYLDASEIGMMTTQTHSILKNGSDVDWVTFTLTMATDIGLRTYGPEDQWTDTVMWLYGSDGVPTNPIAMNDDISSNLWSMIKISLMPGTYYVMIEAYDFAAEIPVYWLELNYSYNMNEPPSAYIEMYPWNPAVGVPMTFSGQNSYDADGYITSYEWSFSDGTTDSGAVVNHTFYAEGVYNITLVVTDDDGATGWSNVGVWVNQNDPPVVNFSYYPANPTLYQYVTFSGWGSYDPDGYIQYYIWTVDNTTQYWTYNPQMDYYFTTPGDHVVTLTAFDNMGASASMSLIVHINEPPVAVITVSPDVGKVGGVCTFDASGSYDPEGGPLTYEWNFGDGMNYTDPVVNYVFYTAGLHTVYLYVVDSVGSWAYTQISYVVVNPMPPLAIISYSPSRPAVGQQVTFDGFASVDPDGSIATYIWQFGDGVVAFGQVATHAYEHAGVYTVKLTVMDEDNLVDDDVGTITVASAPVAAFEHIPISPAAGEVANFFAYGSSDESGLVSYEWSFGDGYYANGWQAPHAFASAGSYTVKLTVTNTYGVKATATQVVVVGAAGPTLAALPGLTGGNGWTADTSAGSNAGMSASASSELLDGVVLMTFGLAMLACVLARQRVRK